MTGPYALRSPLGELLAPPPPALPAVPAIVADVTRIAFEGGGLLGGAHAGVMLELEQAGVRPTQFAGTSAGALVALCLATDHTAKETLDLLWSTRWRDWMPRKDLWALPYNIFARGGVYGMEEPRRWVTDRLRHVHLRPDATFRQLLERTGCDLRVAITLYGRHARRWQSQALVVGSSTRGEWPVRESVLASMAVPLLWQPPALPGEYFGADGGVMLNEPVAAFGDDVEPESVLAVRLVSAPEVHDDALDRAVLRPAGRPSLIEAAQALIGMARRHAQRAHVPEVLWRRTIAVPVPEEWAFDFRGWTPHRANALARLGRGAFKAFLRGRRPPGLGAEVARDWVRVLERDEVAP